MEVQLELLLMRVENTLEKELSIAEIKDEYSTML